MLRTMLCAAGLIAISACATSSQSVPSVRQLADWPTDPDVHERLWPGDALTVQYLRTPELDASVVIGPEGSIQLPLIGRLVAAGKTPGQLEQEIEAGTGEELRDPTVTVLVTGFEGRAVHVGGEVKDPGRFLLQGPTTTLEALFQAGGLLPTADLENVRLVRHVEGGQRQMFRVDIAQSLERSGPDGHVRLLPDDVLYVPRSGIANVNVWVDQYIRKNLPFSVSIRPDLTND